MRTTLPFLALASLGASAAVSWPSKPIDITPLNFPSGALNTMLSKRDLELTGACPSQPNICGLVTYKDNTYTNFGQGTCMQLGPNVQTIYVAKCYCSLWNVCLGNAENDVYVDGMMMCQKPKSSDEFGKEVKYISCGGLN
ncbi:hypothetical protein N0V86_008885 [Didymella sp. IMI 355093]|nr:hypothetical protein N0V86_008885 [Didymella sp. IMI 355093]